MACRWVIDKSVPGGKYHIPECWGTVHDPEGFCICEDKDTQDFDDFMETISTREPEGFRLFTHADIKAAFKAGRDSG